MISITFFERWEGVGVVWKQGKIQPVRSVFEYQTQCHKVVKFGNLVFLLALLLYFQLVPGFLSR